MPKGVVWKVLSDATGLVKLNLVIIDDHFNHAVMQMLIACLAHHLFSIAPIPVSPPRIHCKVVASLQYILFLVGNGGKHATARECTSAVFTSDPRRRDDMVVGGSDRQLQRAKVQVLLQQTCPSRLTRAPEVNHSSRPARHEC